MTEAGSFNSKADLISGILATLLATLSARFPTWSSMVLEINEWRNQVKRIKIPNISKVIRSIILLFKLHVDSGSKFPFLFGLYD